MNLKVRFWLLGLALASVVVLSACGSTSGGGGGALNVSMLDTLKFDPATLSVKAGTASSINVKNTGAQQHNFVVVATADADRVATEAAAKNGDATGIAGVLAGGKPVAGAGSETVSVNVPAGSYTYICTIPGHYQAGMKGTLTAQ